ncbi:MAG: LysM peptidoglycan-binding domain-containing protein, partial [Thermodesulfobacteriaceae bacterium]|nr:LysM peptidoglycan-binding domain-containing protein [Thermodesulfobacteriaceae bacterium]
MKKNYFLEIFISLWVVCFIITLSSAWAKEKVFHTVKKGETLESIAKSYNTTVEEIKKLNNLKTNRLKIGQKLVVESRERAKESPKERSSQNFISHTVKKGETLERIAKTYGVTVEEIKEANRLKKNQIQVGQKILIPEKTKKEETPRKRGKLGEKRDEGEEREEALSDIEKSLKSLEERVKKLEAQSSKNKKAWLEIISEYRRLYLLYPGSKQAPKCLLKIAELHYKLYKDFGSKRDLNEAIQRYEMLVNRYPKAEEVEQVYFQLAQIYKKDLNNLERAKYWAEKLEKEFPKSRYLVSLKESPKITSKKTTFKLEEPRKEGIRKEEAKREETQRLKEVPKKEIAKEEVKKSLEVVSNQTSQIPSPKEPSLVADKKRITNIKPISGEDYTRVIIESSGKLEYQANILKESKGKPPRIYIDLFPASVDSSFPKELEIKDAHLTKIRVGQFDKNTVRVVLDLNSLTSYKIFSLEEPYQLILDLVGKEEVKISKVVPKDRLKTHKGSRVVRGDSQKLDSQRYINLARQLGLGVKRVVIDPGHGGEDPGAVN